MGDKLYSPRVINEIKKKYGFSFTKSLGQNFIIDGNVIDEIAELSLTGKDDLVIEIGPGVGVLTDKLARIAKKVIAIEIDQKLIPILNDTLSEHSNVEIINQDILKTDLQKIIDDNFAQEEYSGVRIIGNLPYYITTPIIMMILEKQVTANSITVMMQKEVADRIKAKPRTKAYGALSVAVQYYCQVEDSLTVPKEVFMPQPKVDSTVVRLDIRKEKEVEIEDTKQFFSCVKAGFGMRRKTLLNSLMGIEGISKDNVRSALERAGIDPSRRGETLTISEFAMLSKEINKKG